MYKIFKHDISYSIPVRIPSFSVLHLRYCATLLRTRRKIAHSRIWNLTDLGILGVLPCWQSLSFFAWFMWVVTRTFEPRSVLWSTYVDYCGSILYFVLKMTAILRVKRKNTNAPLDTVVIACKRLKTSSDTSPVETVLQFAGTLTDPVRMIFSLLLFSLMRLTTTLSHISFCTPLKKNRLG